MFACARIAFRGLNVSRYNAATRGQCSIPNISQHEYEHHSNETLEKLFEYFDSFPENFEVAPEFDVSCAMGVLNAVISKEIGTYVINKQSPNRQIWLSSPVSGPKRYDWVSGKWVYHRDNEALDSLLTREFRKIFKTENIDFSKNM